MNDIRLLREAMQQVSEMETELARLGDKVSGRSIELKSTLKKRLSAPTMVEVRFGEAWLCGTVRYGTTSGSVVGRLPGLVCAAQLQLCVGTAGRRMCCCSDEEDSACPAPGAARHLSMHAAAEHGGSS